MLAELRSDEGSKSLQSPSMTIPEPKWLSPSGEVIACVEKLKVLRENLDEIRQLCQDALEDAILMGCDDHQFREVLVNLIAKLENPYSNTADEAKPRKTDT
jgi:hypothetical protein